MSDSSQMSEIARRVRALRTARGWSQLELAEHAGVSRPSVARVEAGEDVNTGTLRALCAALGLKLGLLEGVPDNSTHALAATE
ncbi:helix-turn-helix domain-containing protein [Microcella sp.]|uniref:helix-turn-helix domain-containing protein n=1 Tax=Microcella sp. TaxID=1913979 RepID=UPI0039191869